MLVPTVQQLQIIAHAELYSRSKLILSSQIRSDTYFDELEKKIKIKFTGISELDPSFQLTMI